MTETEQLQLLLNARFGVGLKVDGGLGPHTLNTALLSLLAETEFLRAEVTSLREALQDLTHTQDNLIEGPKPSP